MGAPSPCPVMPPRVKVVCSVSRYALEDIVVVQVCCRLSRTILVVRVVAEAAGAARATDVAAGATDAVLRKLRRFISAPIYFSLRAATSSLVQYSSWRLSMRTIGVRWVVAL